MTRNKLVSGRSKLFHTHAAKFKGNACTVIVFVNRVGWSLLDHILIAFSVRLHLIL